MDSYKQKQNSKMLDYHRKCGLNHSKPWNVKWKKKGKKKNKRPNNQRQDLPILSFPIHISHYYRNIKLGHLQAKHNGSSLKLIKRSQNSWLQSTNIRVHIIHPTLDIHHHEFYMTKAYTGLECLIPSKPRQSKSSHSELHLKLLQLLSLFQERINHCLAPNFCPLNSQVTQKPFAIPYKTHLQVNKCIMQKYHKNTKSVLYY